MLFSACAPLAELVDARDLKSLDRLIVPVRVRQGAPISNKINDLDAKVRDSPPLYSLGYSKPCFSCCFARPPKPSPMKFGKHMRAFNHAIDKACVDRADAANRV